ncbi:amino acid permease [Umbelopsis sp. PMI_123]|nr:amino acid permease [Umbelopsis sp. PMI_123]
MENEYSKQEKDYVENTYAEDGAETVNQPTLKRQLKNRHIAMISIGGVIGTGLFLGTANALMHGGPAGLLLGYAIMGSIAFAVMNCLGEMISYLPVRGGHIKLAERIADPALGFAMGWNYWYNWVIVLPAELSAAAVLINYWNDTINNAVWMTICLAVVVTINFLGARAYGEAEFWFASIKVLTIVGLIILGIIIAAGGGPSHIATGVNYWKDPGAWVQYKGIQGALGRFLGFFSVLIQAAFSYIGTEIVAIAAGEASNPRKNLPKAIKKVYIRIVLFYILGTFIIGLICPANDPRLATGSGNAASSPFVIGIETAGIPILPHIINACLLTSAWSAASSDMYTSSRALFGLAISGSAPKIFARTTKSGLPYPALIVSLLFSFLAYMAVSTSAWTVFGWFSNMTSICGLITWTMISITYLRFHAGMKAQGIDRTTLPFKSPLGTFGGWYVLISTIIILFFSGWEVFLYGEWDTATFITTYLPIPFAIILFVGYKVIKKTHWNSVHEMDFHTGIDEIEADTDEEVPTTIMGKFFDAL